MAVADTEPLPFVLSFTDLTYSVKNNRRHSDSKRSSLSPSDAPSSTAKDAKTKVLLDSVSGEARDGEILADDLLFPMLTVEETLNFSAEFRLPCSLSSSKKKARVQTLIDQLGLRSSAKTIIGDEGHRGVSGGERRRVSIGIDIIHNPIVLFLDEPTSGLDSTSTFMVVKVLQRIAKSGSIVVMTVHQPSSRILGLLDRLIFLSRGQTVYYGPPEALPSFFSAFGRPMPENENWTEFALDVIRDLEGSPGGTTALVEFNRSTRGVPATTTRHVTNLSLKDAISASISRGKLVSGSATFANPFWMEIGTLTKRSATNMRRMPELFLIRLGAVLVTGFILATIFWRLESSPKGVQERLGFFVFAVSTIFYTCADAVPVFLLERYIFMRETAHNAYRRSSYVLSNVIVAVPSLVFLSVAFALITFFAVGLAGGVKGFLYFFLIILASFWAGISFVTFLSGVVSHVMLGYTVVVPILAYFLLFSGFFINRDRIPPYWIWFHYISLVKYPYEAVLQNEFGSTTKCFVSGSQIFDNTPLGNLSPTMKEGLLKGLSASLGVNITGSTCVTRGTDILRQQGITDLSKWDCLWITVAWGFLFRILFYFALLLGSKNKR
ncbi:ABC transporter G family member 6 [Acorus calamus]|uniref:ABC transporter G family member 6 n=1 Tax=Acorus calamus TaxID=4465 RepID=A0AAV9D8I4_ACOCL|nr:ABC transporter G family member 6 [Acorus calamus]